MKDEEKIKSKNEDNLIISIKKDGDNYFAQTGIDDEYFLSNTYGEIYCEYMKSFSKLFGKII